MAEPSKNAPQRPRIATLRLVLRHLTRADRPALMDILGRWEVVKNLARWPHPLDPKMVDDLIARHAEEPTGGFGIDLGGRIIGLIGSGPSAGFMLHPDYWGLGYMAEALNAVTTYGFEQLGHEAILGNALSDNLGSVRVFQKCGWREVGQGHCYSKARDEVISDRIFLKAKRFDWLEPIKTDRLVIRPMEDADFDAIWPIVSDYDTVKMLWTWPWPADEALTRERLQNAQARAGLLSAITKAGQTIGFVGCQQGSLFYALDARYRGKGLASEAARGKIARAFEDPSLQKLTAGTWDDNPASAHMLTKLGFKQTGHATVFHPARGQKIGGPDFELTREHWKARATH